MKAIFKNTLMGYSGKCDGVVYYYSPKHRLTLARRLRKAKPNPGTVTFTAVAHQLKALGISTAYKADLKRYCDQYKLDYHDFSLSSWINVLNKLFWAMAKRWGIELSQITREQIFEENLPVKTVKAAVEAGLLPPVKGYESLDAVL